MAPQTETCEQSLQGYGSVLPRGACLLACLYTRTKLSPPSKLLFRKTSRQDVETNEIRSYQSK